MRTAGPGPRFDAGIEPGGYSWWYVDALSNDGRYGLTIIALLGSVFSPYYVRSRRGSGRADPLEHSALNVALYGACGHRWAMTERRRADVQRAASTLRIGPSALDWDGSTLTIRIDEITVPWPRRIRGTVTVRTEALFDVSYPLDSTHRHRWEPIAPRATVAVELDSPRLSWQGDGYLDSNHGDAPLESDFDGWTWSRASVGDDTVVFYDVERADNSATQLALAFGADGVVRPLEPPPIVTLPSTLWRIARRTRSESGAAARIVSTLEDGPFYARSMVGAQLRGVPVIAMHESLSLRRFRAAWVRSLLPFRMPRPAARPRG